MNQSCKTYCIKDLRILLQILGSSFFIKNLQWISLENRKIMQNCRRLKNFDIWFYVNFCC